MPEETELTLPEIQRLVDPKQLERQARLNTLAVGQLRRYVGELTPAGLREELEAERRQLRLMEPDGQRLPEVERMLAGLSEEASQGAAEVFYKEQQRLELAIRDRQRRGARLLERRNALQAEASQRATREAAAARDAIPKRLLGEELDGGRRQLLEAAVRLQRQTEDARRALPEGPEFHFDRLMVAALLRSLNGVVHLLGQVPKFRNLSGD